VNDLHGTASGWDICTVCIDPIWVGCLSKTAHKPESSGQNRTPGIWWAGTMATSWAAKNRRAQQWYCPISFHPARAV